MTHKKGTHFSNIVYSYVCIKGHDVLWTRNRRLNAGTSCFRNFFALITTLQETMNYQVRCSSSTTPAYMFNEIAQLRSYARNMI